MSRPAPRTSRRTTLRIALHTALVAVAVLLAASPLLAYTIYLKDGNTLIARDKYVVRDGKAYFTLQNGTRTFLNATEIDTQRTEKANQRDVGTALVVEGGKVRQVPIGEMQRKGREERPTLRDLITSGAAGPSNMPEPEPEPSTRSRVQEEPTLPHTTGGFVDLAAVDKKDFVGSGVASALRQQFQRRDLEDVEVYQGTTRKRPLVEVVTGSEAGVFRAIVVAAGALLQMEDQSPGRIEAMELLLTTPGGNRGGQFVITPDMAHQLLNRDIEVTDFFLRYVQF